MQTEKHVLNPVTVNEVKEAHKRVKRLTVDNVYASISRRKGIDKLSPAQAHRYEYETRKSIILICFKENMRIVVRPPEEPTDINKRLIPDLHINHRMSAAQISQYIPVSEDTAKAYIKKELNVINSLKEVLGVEVIRKSEVDYINSDESVDALKFAFYLPSIIKEEIRWDEKQVKV